jgi:hypothetical protein
LADQRAVVTSSANRLETRRDANGSALRLEDFQRVQNSGSQTIEPGKHKAIHVAEGYPLWRSAPQHIELSQGTVSRIRFAVGTALGMASE